METDLKHTDLDAVLSFVDGLSDPAGDPLTDQDLIEILNPNALDDVLVDDRHLAALDAQFREMMAIDARTPVRDIWFETGPGASTQLVFRLSQKMGFLARQFGQDAALSAVRAAGDDPARSLPFVAVAGIKNDKDRVVLELDRRDGSETLPEVQITYRDQTVPFDLLPSPQSRKFGLLFDAAGAKTVRLHSPQPDLLVVTLE